MDQKYVFFCIEWSKRARPQYLNTDNVQGAGSTRYSSLVSFAIWYLYTEYL